MHNCFFSPHLINIIRRADFLWEQTHAEQGFCILCHYCAEEMIDLQIFPVFQSHRGAAPSEHAVKMII